MMAVSWLHLLLAVSILVSTVLLSIVCLNCRNKRPLASIPQTNPSEDYMPSTQFRLISPVQTTELNSAHPSSHLLSPISPLVDAGSQRRQCSYTPTETESNPSYENPADEPNYINTESDAEDPGYIIVLPEGETPQTNQSRASTPSSDVQHLYENVPKAEDAESEDRDYLNVEPLTFHPSTADLSIRSDSDSSSSDDDEGNYVNQPPVPELRSVRPPLTPLTTAAVYSLLSVSDESQPAQCMMGRMLAPPSDRPLETFRLF